MINDFILKKEKDLQELIKLNIYIEKKIKNHYLVADIERIIADLILSECKQIQELKKLNIKELQE